MARMYVCVYSHHEELGYMFRSWAIMCLQPSEPIICSKTCLSICSIGRRWMKMIVPTCLRILLDPFSTCFRIFLHAEPYDLLHLFFGVWYSFVASTWIEKLCLIHELPKIPFWIFCCASNCFETFFIPVQFSEAVPIVAECSCSLPAFFLCILKTFLEFRIPVALSLQRCADLIT